MPHIHVNCANLYYEKQGRGPEAIVFAHGLLWSGRMFDNQVAAFKELYRCITFDFRGQGQSQVTRNGYDMDTLSEDAAAVIEKLHAAPCHFVGLSMGGFIGMRLAIRRPHLLKSLILLETSADPELTENISRYRTLAWIARWLGIGLVANKVMPIMFGKKFMSDPTRAALRKEWKRRLIANRRVGVYRAAMGVINRQGVYDQLDRINVPTLIVAADQDVATPLAKSERVHDCILDSKLVVIPGAGHTSNVEEPEMVNVAIEEFLKSLK
jgi:3-oxoadipate enol-lactonase